MAVPGTLTEQLKVDEGKGDAHVLFNLPIPESQRSTTFDATVQSTFRPTAAYIRHRVFPDDNAEVVEYELSAEDEEWLKGHARFGPGSRSALSEDLFEAALDLLERRTGKLFPIAQQEAVAACRQSLRGFDAIKDNRVIEEIYNYWIQKRTRLRRPLLRRFWPAVSPGDTNPNLTFRPREKERYRLRKKRQNDIESLDKLLALRNDFEMVRVLLELIKRREQLHEYEAALLEDQFERELFEVCAGGKGAGAGASGAGAAAPPPRAPLQIDVGPLPKSEVDVIFDVARTPPPQPSKPPASPGPDLFDYGGAEEGADGTPPARPPPKKKKKLVARAPLEQQLLAGGSPPLAQPPVPGGAPDLAPAPADEAAPDELPPIPLESSLPLRAQRFLVGDWAVQGAGLSYAHASEVEASLPVVPTFPPSVVPAAPLSLAEQQLLLLRQPGADGDGDGDGDGAGPLDGAPEDGAAPSAAAAVRRALAELVPDRPRFRARPRVGRGGRFIIDRVPLSKDADAALRRLRGPPSASARVREVWAGPEPLARGQVFLDPLRARSDHASDLTLASAAPVSLNATQAQKVQALYLQEDSEDEDVLVLEYPYLVPLAPDPEETARVSAAVSAAQSGKLKSWAVISEPKFRLMF